MHTFSWIAFLAITLIFISCGPKGSDSSTQEGLALSVSSDNTIPATSSDNTIPATRVTFDNTNVTLSSDNLQAGLEEILGELDVTRDRISDLEDTPSDDGQCPDGMTSIHGGFCIDNNADSTQKQFHSAVNHCALQGKSLCRPAQWLSACMAVESGDVDTVTGLLEAGDWEWVDNVFVGYMPNGEDYNLAVQMGGGTAASKCHTVRNWPMAQGAESEYPSASSFRCCK